MERAIHFNSHDASRVRAKFDALKIPRVEFLSLKQTTEWELSEDGARKAKLKRCGFGSDLYYEYAISLDCGHRHFRVIWDLDWDQSEDVLSFLDIAIIELPPKLTDNSNPTPGSQC